MPNPYASDLHINAPLSSVSVRYAQQADRYIATKIFPSVPVEHRSDIFWKYSKSDWLRTEAAKRAPATESAGTGFRVTSDQYYCDVYALHKDIDDQTRANADSNFKLDSDATKLITGQLLLKRDIDWAAEYFASGKWAYEYTGNAAGTGSTAAGLSPSTPNFMQWDQAASDPLGDTTDWFEAFDELTGFMPNKMVIGVDVWKALKNHPQILDRIKYTQKGVVTEDLVAEFFGVGKLVVARARKTTVGEMNDAVAQDAAATYSRVYGKKSAALFYAPDSPGVNTPSAGYTFTWNGYSVGNKAGIRVKQFRLERQEVDRVEASMTYDMKLVSGDCGVFLNTVVV